MRNSIRTRLTIIFIGLAVGPLLLVGSVLAWQSFAAQEQQALSAQHEVAQRVSTQVTAFFERLESELQIVSHVQGLQDLDRERQQEVLAELLSLQDAFEELVLLDGQGRELIHLGRVDVFTELGDRAQADEFARPTTTGKVYYSPVHIDEGTGEPSMIIAEPLLDVRTGASNGVLVAKIRFKKIWDLIADIDVAEGQSVYLVDANNDVVAHHNPSVVRKGTKFSALVQDGIQPGLTGARSVLAIQRAVFGEQLLNVVVEQEWTVALAPAINSLILIGAVIVLALGIAAALGFVSVRQIVQPIQALATTAQQISAGDLTVQARVTSRDEIGTLATTFNDMTAQLRNLISELEGRVEARTAQLRTSAEVGRAVTSILEPEQLLKQVADLITDRFGFYYAAVFVLNEEGQQAVLRAATGEAGRILLERSHRLPVDEKSMVGTAIITGRPRIALDVGQGAVRFANPLLPNTRSEIALPLRAGSRNLGALDVQSEQAGAFDEANAEVLQAMADQIAVALLNAETFTRSEQQTKVMALLNQLSRNLATATSLEDIALAMLPISNSLLEQPRLAIVQRTANPLLLALREFSSDSDRPVGDSIPIEAEGSLIGACIVRDETIYTADLSTVADEYSDAANFYQQGLRSSIALPLHVGEHVLGALHIGSDQAHAYQAEQINQLEQIASQLAITIENLNLAEQTQQTLAEFDAVNRQLVKQAWGEYTRNTQLETAEWHNGTWSVSASRLPQDEPSQAVIPAAPPLTLPIKVRGTTIGEFDIASADVRRLWDDDDMTFAQSLVAQVGQVLETARLLDETERTAQREKAVADAADKIHRSADVESVLQSAVTELQRITGRHGISVQLGFGRTSQAGSRAPDGESGGDR